MAEPETHDLTGLTVDLLSAYFESNMIESDQLAGLIRTTHEALKTLGAPETPAEPGHVPAVSARKSLASPDHILSMIDGKPYKTLKRHLGKHGLTPAEYRTRYKLPSDYPMVAKSYSEHRRTVAEKLGLGRKIKSATAKAEVAGTATADVAATPKKVRARKAATAPAPTAETAAAPKARTAGAKTTSRTASVAKPKAARATKVAPVAAEAQPAAEAPKARVKRTPLKLNLSALKGKPEPAAD